MSSGTDGLVPEVDANSTRMSPALVRNDRRLPAYEVKFFLDDALAREIQNRLTGPLTPDVHGDPAHGMSYDIATVYFDTPTFQIYQRADGFRSRKFRARRYGSDPTIYLERKTRRGQRVRKFRTPVSLEEMTCLLANEFGTGVPSPGRPFDWPARWFVEQARDRNLKPVYKANYSRLALDGGDSFGPIRVTFDRDARGAAFDGDSPAQFAGGVDLLGSKTIVEFKFLEVMPPVLKDVIEEFRLAPGSASKYRRGIDALGLGTGGQGHA